MTSTQVAENHGMSVAWPDTYDEGYTSIPTWTNSQNSLSAVWAHLDQRNTCICVYVYVYLSMYLYIYTCAHVLIYVRISTCI